MPQNLNNLNSALVSIKNDIENAIRTAGSAGKNNLIRTQKPIKLLHEVVKAELVSNGICENRIRPGVNESNGELTLAGFFKTKDQDVCVTPVGITKVSDEITQRGTLLGYTDPFGIKYTERVLSINVRSQLSSMAKNFDTLYERTFAEALNLHQRCPRMVLGEFYMIAVNEYDSNAANSRKVKYRSISGIKKHIEKYLLSFEALNNRTTVDKEHYKYEKVCLLIVDFGKDTPIVYSSDSQLKAANLMDTDSKASIKGLDFNGFIGGLIDIYCQRFGASSFKE